MRRSLSTLLCAILMSGAVFAQPEIEPGDWAWSRPITVPEDAHSSFVRVPLTPEVVDGAQPSLQDVRIVDESSRLVPFVIQRPEVRDAPTVLWRPVDLINRTFNEDEFARVVLSFDDDVRKNRIKVELSGENFRRRALLEGSNDLDGWSTVHDSAWLFDITRPDGRYAVDTIDFPVNRFRYMRLTVFNMADDPARIEIRSVQMAFTRPAPEPALKPVDVHEFSQELDEETNQTIIEMDVGYRHLPIASLALDIADPYFHRAYRLYGRNAETETIERRTETGRNPETREVPWRSLRSGVVYRVQHSEKLSEALILNDLSAPYRYLKLVVFNGDNTPLDVRDVYLSRHPLPVLVFESDAGADRLVGGNPEATAPKFDLARSVSAVHADELSEATLGPVTELKPDGPDRPWTERNRWVIWLALVLAAAVLGGMVVRALRSA